MDPKESKMQKKSIKVDIQGGHGGSHWDDGAYTGIREITLVYDRCIDSIQVEYDKKGKSLPGHKHGGNGGSRIVRVKLQYPEEYLTNVSGHYSPVVHGGTPVIRSLTFKTNQRTYGPYGAQDGTPFSFSMDGGHIVGFHGRSGWYLDAIGFRISHMETQGLCDALQIKFIKKFGELASKTLGYKDHDQHAPNFKATT